MTKHQTFTLGIIPARGGSKGLPGKNLRMLGGKPLIAHTIEAASKAQCLDRVIVSTDDQAIADIAIQWGAEVPFMRPKYLAEDTTAMVPVLRHAVEEMERAEGKIINPVVLLQPTSPFRTSEDIENCVELFAHLNPDVVFSAQRSQVSPYYNLVECDEEMPWIKLCNEGENVLWRRQDAPSTWISHGSVIAYDRKALFTHDQHLWMPRKAIYEMPEERICDIDTERDLMWAEFLLSVKGTTVK